MAERLSWLNSAEHNPVLAVQMGREAFALSNPEVAEVVDTKPIILDQLYYPGPQGETHLFFGMPRPSGTALLRLPTGEVIYHVVAVGRTAHPRRVQLVNVSEQNVAVSFLCGSDPFKAPRLRSDIIVPAGGEYDLACDFLATAGESLTFVTSVEGALIGAISGHVNDEAGEAAIAAVTASKVIP